MLLCWEIKTQVSSQGAAAKAALLTPHTFFPRVQIIPFLMKSSPVRSCRPSPTGTLSSSSTRTLVSDRTRARSLPLAYRHPTCLLRRPRRSGGAGAQSEGEDLPPPRHLSQRGRRQSSHRPTGDVHPSARPSVHLSFIYLCLYRRSLIACVHQL